MVTDWLTWQLTSSCWSLSFTFSIHKPTIAAATAFSSYFCRRWAIRLSFLWLSTNSISILDTTSSQPVSHTSQVHFVALFADPCHRQVLIWNDYVRGALIPLSREKWANWRRLTLCRAQGNNPWWWWWLDYGEENNLRETGMLEMQFSVITSYYRQKEFSTQFLSRSTLLLARWTSSDYITNFLNALPVTSLLSVSRCPPIPSPGRPLTSTTCYFKQHSPTPRAMYWLGTKFIIYTGSQN